MNWIWLILITTTFLTTIVRNEDDEEKEDHEERCLNLPDVNPRKYFFFEGTVRDINIEISDRATHQLNTWIFYYFIKEIVGYDRLRVVKQRDNFNVFDVISRLADTETIIANSTINLEVWIPPDFDTYAMELVKECGTVAPPGRFGWFIPINLTEPIIDYYNPDNKSDIHSIHWRHFRNRKFVKNFDIPSAVIKEANISLKEIYVPSQCLFSIYEDCALLLTSNKDSMDFVRQHIKESRLYVKVLYLGDHLRETIEKIEKIYKENDIKKSLVILSWVPSDVVLFERDFLTVSFENWERFNFNFSENRHIGYKYEMHRLVKGAWNKIESSAKPLYDMIRGFKFEKQEYEQLLKLYEENRDRKSLKEISCDWMRANKNIWIKWHRNSENVIYIGGIFPISSTSYNGKGIVKAAQMAMKAINNDKRVLADYRIEIILTDGMCRADNVMKNFIDFIINSNYYKNLVGVLGPACSDTVEPLAGVSKHFHIMVISYSAEGASFSNRIKYPYFFRTIGENKHYKHVYLELFKKFGWKRLAALTEDGQKYTEYISLMQNELEQNGISFIANKKFPRERETEPMTRHLEDLKNRRARIIIADVVDEIARQVMCEAFKLKMTANEGYIWFLPMWLDHSWYNTTYFNTYKNETVNCTTEEMKQAIIGYLAMTHAYFAPPDQIMQENITVGEWNKNYKQVSNYAISDYGGFAYDAVWVYALALDKLSKNDPASLADMHSISTTNKLVKLIEQTDFYGVSGRIKFRGGPSRFSVIKIMQFYNDEIHEIGEFYPNLTDHTPEILGGHLKMNNNALRWFTPDGDIPDDGTLPLYVCPIESIAVAFNVECQTAMVIVNCMVAVCLVLIVVAVCIYLKFKYDRRVKKQKAYMEKLGLRYERKYTMDLEEFEVNRENVELTRRLGQGAFGTVYGGETFIQVSGWVPVAVKTLKGGSTSEDKIDFLAEADNMKRFDHRNVVKLIGVITRSTPLATLMEYCLYGDLKNFLLARRHLVYQNLKDADEVSPKRLSSMALDIARGLSYLASIKYVHRDLACRNCLVNAQRMVKIGDFGMSRPMNDYECYRFTRKGMLPVRWMAPESLTSGVFTTASDIWSYGVVLYEMVTFGCTPWVGKANMEVVDLVMNGKSLLVPKGVKPQLEGLMKSCWAQDPKERPPASSIVEFIANMPKLLHPCMDVPVQSIKLDEEDSIIDPQVARNFRLGNDMMMMTDSPQETLMLPMNGRELWTEPALSVDQSEELAVTTLPSSEGYCQKAPLLGTTNSPSNKCSNGLLSFAKFSTSSSKSNNGRSGQSSRKDSGCLNDHDEINNIEQNNSPSSGYANSKL